MRTARIQNPEMRFLVFMKRINQCDFGYKKDDSLIKLIITGIYL